MKLEPLMTVRIRLGEPIPIGDMGLGQRMIGVVADGSFEGARLKGRVVQPGADWVVMDSEGFGAIDVRLALVTEDGANIYMNYTGLLQFTEAILGGQETAFGDNYFVTQPRFETGAAAYSWLNRVVAVAEGRGIAGGVEYQVYHCQPGES